MQDLELHINHNIDLALHLLIEQNGEFYPFCSYVNTEGKLIPYSQFEGNEYPTSSELMESYISFMQPKLENNEIISFIIAFDCRAPKDENSEKVDAIAIDYYSIENPKTTYFYPYLISNGEVILQEPWGVINE